MPDGERETGGDRRTDEFQPAHENNEGEGSDVPEKSDTLGVYGLVKKLTRSCHDRRGESQQNEPERSREPAQVPIGGDDTEQECRQRNKHCDESAKAWNPRIEQHRHGTRYREHPEHSWSADIGKECEREEQIPNRLHSQRPERSVEELIRVSAEHKVRQKKWAA